MSHHEPYLMGEIMDIEHLLKQYELGQIRYIKKDQIGSGENYIIQTDKGKFFAKFFKIDDLLNNPKLEVMFNDILLKNCIPVAEFIRNKKDKVLTRCGTKIAHIQKFVEGRIYYNNTLPGNILWESAKILGKIHDTLSQYKISNLDFVEKVSNIQEKLHQHILLHEKIKNSKDVVKYCILDDLDYKINLLQKYSSINLKDFLCNFTYNLSHGDYNCRQLIIHNRKIVAIIDFSRMANVPIAWEITRSFTLGSKTCKNANLDISQFIRYLSGYKKHFTVSNFDAKYMWELYKIQLLGSVFGYEDYIRQGDKKLLDFAIWRTNLIRSINQNSNIEKIA